MTAFLDGVPEELRRPPANVLRLTLHPDGLARRIRNLGQWRAHMLRRLRRQLVRTAAEGLGDLLAELESYPVPGMATDLDVDGRTGDLAIPMRLTSEYGELSFLDATTVFGSPLDVTLDEIALETFFPSDRRTADILRELSAIADRSR